MAEEPGRATAPSRSPGADHGRPQWPPLPDPGLRRPPAGPPAIWRTRMELSARNQLQGTVKSVTLGAVMAEVVVDVNGQEVVSAITRGSAERLGLSEGSAVTVVLKSTDVLPASDQA